MDFPHRFLLQSGLTSAGGGVVDAQDIAVTHTMENAELNRIRPDGKPTGAEFGVVRPHRHPGYGMPDPFGPPHQFNSGHAAGVRNQQVTVSSCPTAVIDALIYILWCCNSKGEQNTLSGAARKCQTKQMRSSSHVNLAATVDGQAAP